MIFNPFLGAGGTIVMRKMKKFHEAVVAFYLNWSIMLTNLLIVVVFGLGFQPIWNYSWYSWLI